MTISPLSADTPLSFNAGEDAPQPSPTGFSTRAAAHSSLAFCCAVGVLIAAIVTILGSAASVALSPSAAARGFEPPRALPPEAICNVKTGVCVVHGLALPKNGAQGA